MPFANKLVGVLAATTVALTGAVVLAGAASARAPHKKVYAIGDSVMIDAKQNLYDKFPSIHVNADVSRQVSQGIAILKKQRRNHNIAPTTVFGLGTNGSFTKSDLDRIIHLTRGHKLIVITSHCPYCSWTGPNNKMIRQNCKHSRHCSIAPFQARASKHPEWFGGDGVHMAPGGTGARRYAQIVKTTWIDAGR